MSESYFLQVLINVTIITLFYNALLNKQIIWWIFYYDTSDIVSRYLANALGQRLDQTLAELFPVISRYSFENADWGWFD